MQHLPEQPTAALCILFMSTANVSLLAKLAVQLAGSWYATSTGPFDWWEREVYRAQGYLISSKTRTYIVPVRACLATVNQTVNRRQKDLQNTQLCLMCCFVCLEKKNIYIVISYTCTESEGYIKGR